MRLKELRKNKKLTQAEVAKIINTTSTCYNYYEKEKREPSIQTLCILADYYNVSIDYLVGRDYHNDLGYLTSEQKNIMKILKKLNDNNTNEALDTVIKLFR